jgi:hypothetical protein
LPNTSSEFIGGRGGERERGRKREGERGRGGEREKGRGFDDFDMDRNIQVKCTTA